MAPQQGFIYEKNVANYLKPLGLVPRSFTPAGAGHDQPDLLVEYKGVPAGVELKITAASAGSLVLKYNQNNKRQPWGFGDIKNTEKEKLFIKDIADKIKLQQLIKKHWKGVPYKREQDEAWKSSVGKIDKKKRYERDLKLFKDIKGEIPASLIEKYYNQKDTYYVNVGTHGFYLMGRKDPLKLNKEARENGLELIPMFGSAAKAIYRARVQYKGSGNYQFTFELQFSIAASKKSPYNIGATKSKTNVAIDKRASNLSCFADL